MVQRGYSLALDDLEVLPLWEKLLVYSSTMGGFFDNDHVNEWSYEVARDYLHRPTALSLWSLDLLMECPQDHFTFDALDGKGGDERDGVVDGNIYYIDMIFLTWISKHKKEDLHLRYGSFLFIGVCHTIMEDLFMDPIIILLSLHGKNYVFAFIDCPTQYLHALTIYLQCIAPQRGKLFFGLHAPFLANYYDGDIHLLYEFGQVFG